eukprot:1181825-Prorocentrum_minimum.AAC.8
MNWLSEWFDQQGREFNKLIQGDSGKQEKAAATGIVSLRDSNLKTFPDYVFKAAPKVKVLDATNNDLVALPDRFSEFKLLHKVTFAHNKLKSLPPSICLQTITILQLEHNRYYAWPARIPVKSLSSLIFTILPFPGSWHFLYKPYILRLLQRVPENLGMLSKYDSLPTHPHMQLRCFLLPSCLLTHNYLNPTMLPVHRCGDEAEQQHLLQPCYDPAPVFVFDRLRRLELHHNPLIELPSSVRPPITTTPLH